MSQPVTAPTRRAVGSPLGVGALCALAAVVFIALRVAAHDGDITSIIRIGEEIVDPGQPPPSDLYVNDGIGYDGQFFYRQSLDPLSTAAEVEGIPLDRPVYRSSRIVYPAVTWLLAGGDRDLVPWAMVAVNVLAIGAIGVLGASIARDAQRSSWWGLVFAAWPGLFVALAYDLAEPLEVAWVLGALLAYRRQRSALGTALLCAAALTRESSLIFAAAIVGAGALRWLLPRTSERLRLGQPGPHPLLGFVPLAAWMALQAWMSQRWDAGAGTGVSKSADQVGKLPFSKLVTAFADWISDADPVALYQLLQVFVVLVLFALLVATLGDPMAGRAHERLAIVGGLALLTTVGWGRTVLYLRWPTLTALVGLAVFLSSRRERRAEWARDRTVVGAIIALFATTTPIWIFI